MDLITRASYGAGHRSPIEEVLDHRRHCRPEWASQPRLLRRARRVGSAGPSWGIPPFGVKRFQVLLAVAADELRPPTVGPTRGARSRFRCPWARRKCPAGPARSTAG